jgi:hypothetical protein
MVGVQTTLDKNQDAYHTVLKKKDLNTPYKNSTFEQSSSSGSNIIKTVIVQPEDG